VLKNGCPTAGSRGDCSSYCLGQVGGKGNTLGLTQVIDGAQDSIAGLPGNPSKLIDRDVTFDELTCPLSPDCLLLPSDPVLKVCDSTFLEHVSSSFVL
jgi:hypothetical protein